MKTAEQKNAALVVASEKNGIHGLTMRDAKTLRDAEKTLRRWHELECGTGNQWNTFLIERDEESGAPYLRTISTNGRHETRRAVIDKEKHATNRVQKIAQKVGFHFYVQGDPRGCALYISSEPISARDYCRALACCD
jgi:hypothetical protein